MSNDEVTYASVKRTRLRRRATPRFTTKSVFVRNIGGIMLVQRIEKLIRGRTVSTGCRKLELHTQDAGWPGKSFPALNLIGNYQLQMAA